MISTLQRQLAEIRMERRLPEVLEEIPRVRADLGYPIMVMPFSQFIGSQAVMNVATGEGYKNVPDQVIKFVQGDFGEPPAEIDPDVKDRILDRGRARKLAQRDRRNRSTSGAPRSGRTCPTRSSCCGSRCPPNRSTRWSPPGLWRHDLRD